MGNDADTRRRVGAGPVPVFTSSPLHVPPPLSSSRVALLTTAALFYPGESDWRRGDESFRVISGSYDRLLLGHQSANFDQSGFSQDLNSVFPVERLAEMAANGDIGSVAPRHLSFLGTQNESMDTIRFDSGPKAAEVLLEDEVDIVLTLPVCPICTRTGGTIAHVLESCGIATVSISLVRGTSEKLRPPRTLYCEFPFGRPLGKPGDREFQMRVLKSALSLSAREDVPVLEDFSESVESDSEATLACQLPPALPDESLHPAVREAQGITNAYMRSRERRGRSLVGRAVDAAQVPAAINAFVEFLSDGSLTHFDQVGHPTSVAMDIRAYYEEAALELVGTPTNARATDHWFYSATTTGSILAETRKAMEAAGVPADVWYGMAPRGY